MGLVDFVAYLEGLRTRSPSSQPSQLLQAFLWEENCHDPFARAQVYLTTMFTHDLIVSPSFTELNRLSEAVTPSSRTNILFLSKHFAKFCKEVKEKLTR